MPSACGGPHRPRRTSRSMINRSSAGSSDRRGRSRRAGRASVRRRPTSAQAAADGGPSVDTRTVGMSSLVRSLGSLSRALGLRRPAHRPRCASSGRRLVHRRAVDGARAVTARPPRPTSTLDLERRGRERRDPPLPRPARATRPGRSARSTPGSGAGVGRPTPDTGSRGTTTRRRRRSVSVARPAVPSPLEAERPEVDPQVVAELDAAEAAMPPTVLGVAPQRVVAQHRRRTDQRSLRVRDDAVAASMLAPRLARASGAAAGRPRRSSRAGGRWRFLGIHASEPSARPDVRPAA